MSTKLQQMIDRAVREALRRELVTDNQAAVNELTGDGEDNSERQSGRRTGAGFAAAAKEVIQKSDKARQEQEKKMRQMRGW